MSGLLGRGMATLDERNGALIVLVYGDRWGGEALAGQKGADP